MARRPARNRPARSAAELHRAWLELVDTEGPFLAIPPLKRVWPEGMPRLADARKAILADARKDFEPAWEHYDRGSDSESVLDSYRTARDKWVETVLRDVAGWAESLSWGEVSGVAAQSPNRAVTVQAQATVSRDDEIGAIVHVIDPVDSLREVPGDLWAATPVDRVEAMLRESKVPIGIVTDGRWWGVVHARDGVMAASGIVDALTWTEEHRTRDAFLALIGRQYLIGGDPAERLPVLFEDSVAAAEEITEALGAQVRRAVELLIQSFSESAAEAKRRSLAVPLPTRSHDSYEAAVTVMMRAVFLLFAEERGLMPQGGLFDQGYGIAGELDQLTARESAESEEALDATSLSWHRLLATSNALYRGATFENLRIPAYGGSLFDPARFPFLTATNELGVLGLTVSDRVMLHVLRAVQVAEIKGEARRISFRDIDVEQIGYMYEGLLGYTATVAPEMVLGITGTRGDEPEIPLAKLEELAATHSDSKQLARAIRAWIETDQPSAKPSSEAAIAKAVGVNVAPSVVSALVQAVGGDLELAERVKPWLGLVRLDLRNRPFVVLEGALLVKETPSRKNSGAHYTPKSLAEDVVKHALEPLVYAPGPHQTANRDEWKLKSPADILNLKVADIACGSGAFLVAAARFLADRLVEAWVTDNPAWGGRKDLHTLAMREVVATCLYGADINEMAIEMCKLSLWLVSLDRDLPFSFVDDKVFVGNSLLGLTDIKQLRAMHIDPTKESRQQGMLDVFEVDVDSIIKRAVELRESLASPVESDDSPARSAAAKRRQLAQLHNVTADLRKLADGIIATGLSLGGKPGRALDAAYEDLREAARKAFPGAHDDVADSAWLDSKISLGLTPTVDTDYVQWQPLHWIIEAADVMADHGGFDAIIGNPPFLGGQKLTGAMGTNMRDWFVNVLADGRRGSADLVAYFFLRATSLLQAKGTLGLIATNTVAQGDSREVGLDSMVSDGFTITRAVQSRSWPASSANLEYAAVWGTREVVEEDVPRIADDIAVRRISTLLEAQGRTAGNPFRLAENAGIAFQGCIVLGMGFVLEPEEAQEWIAADTRNAEVLFPYLNGEDLNQRPDSSASRWVIDFNDRTEEQARKYPRPFERVSELVRPERMHNRRKPRRDYWWQFAERAAGMRKAISDLSEVLVLAQVSNTAQPMFIPKGIVPSHKIVVFASDNRGLMAVLSSSLHYFWARKYSGAMKNDLSYSPSDVFLTFPRPKMTKRLLQAGSALDRERREIMARRSLGLTKLYNLVNTPEAGSDVDVSRVRDLHVEIDEALIEAYGWDIHPRYGFHTYRRVLRWSFDAASRVDLLDKLLEENRTRAESSPVTGHIESIYEFAEATLFG
ncbi:DNA methyltransferase [Psychromicrobium lacuslunae]|uniref:site-specific DNA-methyltransferase (adenine-specific) n=1 Tax=Psychromicrobium lacuslunae TaxID=1618207 RepID=A0A0D4C2V6_9MICC|nr:DNA methyltransferase [Psychromicrobium lacuslunae]AJT42725.1 Type II restriction enzyme methylase subunit [Psychromicrobium lacuslunae]